MMLPIWVPIGSWRFPTDNLLEYNLPFFDNEGLIWGSPTEGFLPEIYQVSLDAYNEWCQHAYDWVAICNHLEEVDFVQASNWGFEYRGPHDLFNHDSPQRSNSIEPGISEPDFDLDDFPSQIVSETEDASNTSPTPPLE
jgi:hypothetical protein